MLNKTFRPVTKLLNCTTPLAVQDENSNQTECRLNDSSTKNDKSVIIYLPSYRSKPVWLSLFSGT